MDTQRAADATGIPRLSAAAEAAISVVTAVSDEKARAGAWRAVQADERVAGEVRPGAVTALSVTAGQRPKMDRVAELTVAIKAGERAGASLA